MNKTEFANRAKEVSRELAWPESAFVAGAQWALSYLLKQK